MSEICREVNVTAEDIANGIKEASGEYPVALALTRVFPDANIIYVDDGCYITFDDNTEAYFGDIVISTFIDDFDNDRPVQPFSFTFNSDNT